MSLNPSKIMDLILKIDDTINTVGDIPDLKIMRNILFLIHKNIYMDGEISSTFWFHDNAPEESVKNIQEIIDYYEKSFNDYICDNS